MNFFVWHPCRVVLHLLTITVIHCIGWFCMTMYYVRIIFGKTEVNFISEIAKPLSIIVMCIWACYYPHSTESLYIAGASA